MYFDRVAINIFLEGTYNVAISQQIFVSVYQQADLRSFYFWGMFKIFSDDSNCFVSQNHTNVIYVVTYE